MTNPKNGDQLNERIAIIRLRIPYEIIREKFMKESEDVEMHKTYV